MKNKKSVFVVPILVIIVTILLSLLTIKDIKQPINYVSLIFVLLGEVSAFGTIIFISKKTMVSQLAISSVSYVYIIINILFTLIFKKAFENNIVNFVILHLVLLCIYSIVIVILYNLLNHIDDKEQYTIEKKAVMDECEAVASTLLHNSKLSEHKEKLNKIYEEIKYCDHVSDYKSSEILSSLKKITADSDNDIDATCDDILNLIQERIAVVRQSKRGGL